ncbi:hypothetical protein Tco_0948241, partial [Tanacetum coccineum]
MNTIRLKHIKGTVVNKNHHIMAIMHITTTTYPIPPERDGTMALINYVVSEDAKYLAYALSSSRRDWITVKDTELETLIATYDIPLDLRPRLPDSNFRMSILPAGDIAIDKVPTSFNQDHVNRLKAHIVKLRDILEGVLVRSGLSRVWRNLMCDPVLRRSDNTVMSIHHFLCIPSLEKATVREEPHELGTSILGRVVDLTTPPAPAGTTISRASPEEIAVTRPDPNVVAKADHAAKRKTSTRPEISNNTTKRTRLSQRVSGAGSSGLAAGDGVEQTNDGTLDDDDRRNGSESAMEDVENLNDVNQGEHINVIPLRTFDPSLGLDVTYPPILLPDKEVGAHAELSEGVRRTTRASSYASHGVGEGVSSPAQEAMVAPGTQPLGTNAGADEIASDGNVDSYLDARVSNTAGDVLERDLLSFVSGPYYLPYPYDENDGSEIHRLHELSSVELSDRM